MEPTPLPVVTVPEPELPIDEEPGTVPDVRGLSARDATKKLTRFRLNARMQGDGFVVEQDPPPGTPVDEGSVCHLILVRTPVRHAPAARTQ